jgi:homoserine dehydrogenase
MATDQRIVRIGLLGFGTIGSSVYRLIHREHDQILEGTGVDLRVEKVLESEPAKWPADAPAGVFVTDFSEILDDPSIEIVVEVIGGTTSAYDFIDAAMRKGKNIVTTSNCWPPAGKRCSPWRRTKSGTCVSRPRLPGRSPSSK